MRLIRKYFYFSLFFGVMSCGFFEFEKVSMDRLMKEEMEVLKVGGVSEYPLFEACKNFSTKTAQQNCFERTLYTHITTYFEKHQLAIRGTIIDTLWIPVLVDTKGKLRVDTFELPKAYEGTKKPSVLQLLEKSIDLLPPIEPAHIRGISIATRYQLPLILNAVD